MAEGFDLLAHVVVLILDLQRCDTGEFFVDLACEVLEFFLAAFEAVAVVVADNVCQDGFLNRAFDGDEVVESFVAFGVFGCLPARKHDGELVGYAD